MPAGRPPKYESADEWVLCPKVKVFNKVSFDHFDSEDDLCDYIELHKKEFCRDILEEDYKSYCREWDLNQYRVFGARPKRVDFMFKTDKSDCVLVECKNPSNTYAELRNGIAQLMSYRITAIDNGITPDRFILVSSEYHPVIGRMINEYNLPFEVFVLGKSGMMKLIECEN